MSLSNVSAVMGRINAIRAIAPPRSNVSFQATLAGAMSESTVRHAPDRPSNDVAPIGMLGTPVLVRSTSLPTASTELATGDWAERLPEAARPLSGAIERAATEAGLDPRLLAALVWTESNFDPDAVSHAGAVGLTQLMPATAEGLGVDPRDELDNLRGGAHFLSSMIDQFGGIELGLAAYNAGPGRVSRAGGIPDIPETRAYVPRVLERYRLLGGLT